MRRVRQGVVGWQRAFSIQGQARSRQVAENQNPERAGGRRAGCRQIDNVSSAWVRDNR